jgi:hypothetical protein
MARWYQNVLTGEQVEVKTLDEDDFFVENSANWSRIPTPPEQRSEVSEAAARLAEERENNEEASAAGRKLRSARKPAKKG